MAGVADVEAGGTREPRTLIVVPTYQEVENVPLLLERLDEVRSCPFGFDVLVVDDGSPDGTARLISEASSTRPWLHLLERDRPTGLGSAYRAGFAWALGQGYELIGEMDADLSHDPAALQAMISTAAGGPCVVLGSRYTEGGSAQGWPWSRRFVSRAANTFARTTLGLSVRDVTSGFRLYRAGAVAQILRVGTECQGYGFQVEALALLQKAGHHIEEIPITFTDRRFGASKLSSRIALEAAWRCLQLGMERIGSRPDGAALASRACRCAY